MTPLIVIGGFAGMSYRVTTAAVIGANIGAGMVMLAAPVVVIAGLALSASSWRALPGHGGPAR